MGGNKNSVEEYSRQTGLWTLRPNFATPHPIWNDHVIQVDGNAYFFSQRRVMMWNQTTDAYVQLADLTTSVTLSNHKGAMVLHN